MRVLRYYYRFKRNKTHRVIVPVTVGACHIIPDPCVHEVGMMIALTYSSISYATLFLDRYVELLDNWRESQARYEEKDDPPEFDWRPKMDGHTPKVLSLAHELVHYRELALLIVLVDLMIFLSRRELFDSLESLCTFLLDFFF